MKKKIKPNVALVGDIKRAHFNGLVVEVAKQVERNFGKSKNSKKKNTKDDLVLVVTLTSQTLRRRARV